MNPKRLFEDRLVHNKQLDDQHLHLIELMNRACLYSSDYTKCLDLIKEIYQEVLVHFDTENRLMRECGYPHLIAHVNEHNRILEKLQNLIIHYDDHYYGIVYIIDTLLQTIIYHVDNYDLQYVPYINKQEITCTIP